MNRVDLTEFLFLQVQEPHAAEATHCAFWRRDDVESSTSEQHDQVAVRLRAGNPGAEISHGAAPDEVDGGGEKAPEPELHFERGNRFRPEIVGVGASVVGGGRDEADHVEAAERGGPTSS